MLGNWLNYEIVLLKGNRDQGKEKLFILESISPFIESNEALIDLFHFTRIFQNEENYIRWRIKPNEKDYETLKKKLLDILDDLKSKDQIIGFREEPFDVDPTHNELGGKSENYDIFLEFLDSTSRVTIKLLKRNADDRATGYVPSPDYYAHFLFNQFGSHSIYFKCPGCNQGSSTVHPCPYCGTISLPPSFGLKAM